MNKIYFGFNKTNSLIVLVLLELRLLLTKLLLLSDLLLLLLLDIFRTNKMTSLGVERNRELLGNLGAVLVLAFLLD